MTKSPPQKGRRRRRRSNPPFVPGEVTFLTSRGRDYFPGLLSGRDMEATAEKKSLRICYSKRKYMYMERLRNFFPDAPSRCWQELRRGQSNKSAKYGSTRAETESFFIMFTITIFSFIRTTFFEPRLSVLKNIAVFSFRCS